MEIKRATLAVSIGAAFVAGFLAGLWYARTIDDSIHWPDTFGALESVATIIALIVGGIWTYSLFIRGRLGETKGELHHYHFVIEHGSQRILRVGLEIQNIGDVAIKSCEGYTDISLLPPSIDSSASPEEAWVQHHRITYDFVGDKLLIEPKEREHYWRDVVLPPGTRYVQLHSKVACGQQARKGHDFDWDETAVVDLNAAPPASGAPAQGPGA